MTSERNTAMVYETDHYGVFVHANPPPIDFEATPSEVMSFPFRYGDSHFDEGYIIKNKVTGVVEATTTVFPEAVYEAERLTDAIELGSWKWFKTRRDLIASGKIKDENEHQLDVLVSQTSKLKASSSVKRDLAEETA